MVKDKTKPRVLCACAMGHNRSKHLAEFLVKKGYETRYGGVKDNDFKSDEYNPVLQGDIDWADVIVVIRPWYVQDLEEKFDLTGKRIEKIDVSDDPWKYGLGVMDFKRMGPLAFNINHTYPALEKAIEEKLPFES